MKNAEQRLEVVEAEIGMTLTLKSAKALKTVGVGQVHDRKETPKTGDSTVHVFRPADKRDKSLNPVLIDRWCEQERRVMTYLELDWSGQPVLPEIDQWDEIKE